MPETKIEKSPFVDLVPDLKNQKWGGMKREDGEAVIAELLKAGQPAIGQLIEGLREVDDGSDWKERLLLHMLVTHCSVPERKTERGLVLEAYLSAARSDRPATVRAFLLQQLRLIADEAAVPKLAPLLRDEDPLVIDAAAATMVSIGAGAEQALKEALPGAEGHAKEAIEHALHQLG